MTTRVGIREISRRFSAYQDYDYVEIENKKTGKRNGLYVSEKYADALKDYIDKHEQQERQRKLDALTQFAGSLEIDPKYDGLSGAQLREVIAEEKYGA
jgi:hypothetical protein